MTDENVAAEEETNDQDSPDNTSGSYRRHTTAKKQGARARKAKPVKTKPLGSQGAGRY